MRRIILIAHNLRSTHNVGSLMRTAEGLGVQAMILTGYTPYPPLPDDDPRYPHEQTKAAKQIQKTALDAQYSLPWRRVADINKVIESYKAQGRTIIAIEQTPASIALPEYRPTDNLVLIVGREVEGLEPEILEQCDAAVEIPMLGKKESFNVVQAAAMVLYHCRFKV